MPTRNCSGTWHGRTENYCCWALSVHRFTRTDAVLAVSVEPVYHVSRSAVCTINRRRRPRCVCDCDRALSSLLNLVPLRDPVSPQPADAITTEFLLVPALRSCPSFYCTAASRDRERQSNFPTHIISYSLLNIGLPQRAFLSAPTSTSSITSTPTGLAHTLSLPHQDHIAPDHTFSIAY